MFLLFFMPEKVHEKTPLCFISNASAFYLKRKCI